MTTAMSIMLTTVLTSDIVSLVWAVIEQWREVNGMRPVMYPFQGGSRQGTDVGDGEVGGDDLLPRDAVDTGDGEAGMTSGAAGGEAASTHDGGELSRPSEGRARPRGRRTGSSNEHFEITRDRPIFTLSVAADLLGLHPRTLRIYEEKKLVVPSRTEGNRRRYSQSDIERFQFIRFLTGGGVNLEGVRIILDMADELRKLGGDPSAIIERNLQSLGDDQ